MYKAQQAYLHEAVGWSHLQRTSSLVQKPLGVLDRLGGSPATAYRQSSKCTPTLNLAESVPTATVPATVLSCAAVL